MTNNQEYKIAFYTIQGPYGPNHVFDTVNALPQHQLLSFINILQKHEVICLFEDLNKIIRGEHYDPDFLTSSEVYEVYNVQFKNPYFLVDGYESITIQELKPLLEEWLDFLKSKDVKASNMYILKVRAFLSTVRRIFKISVICVGIIILKA